MTGIDHLRFDNAVWIEKTADVTTKLANYDSYKAFHDRVMSQSGKASHKLNGLVKYVVKVDEQGNLSINEEDLG